MNQDTTIALAFLICAAGLFLYVKWRDHRENKLRDKYNNLVTAYKSLRKREDEFKQQQEAAYATTEVVVNLRQQVKDSEKKINKQTSTIKNLRSKATHLENEVKRHKDFSEKARAEVDALTSQNQHLRAQNFEQSTGTIRRVGMPSGQGTPAEPDE